MFLNVGQFQFRSMDQRERQHLMQRMEQDIPATARECRGFRAVYFAWVSDDELMTTWLFDSAADWDAALARFGPLLQEYVVPNLAQPPDRVSGDVVLRATSEPVVQGA